LRLTRIEAFSDGVFAIIVTLLVLVLKGPGLRDPRSASALGHQLLALVPQLLSWLISFVIVCKFWLNHHHVLGLAWRSVGVAFTAYLFTPLFFIVPPTRLGAAQSGAPAATPQEARR
jgi:uncharacterized membrane protein